jgi:hypothetical protein
MSKQERHFEKIQEFKQRFSKLTTESLSLRLNNHQLVKEAAIAAREILKERGIANEGLAETSKPTPK